MVAADSLASNKYKPNNNHTQLEIVVAAKNVVILTIRVHAIDIGFIPGKIFILPIHNMFWIK